MDRMHSLHSHHIKSVCPLNPATDLVADPTSCFEKSECYYKKFVYFTIKLRILVSNLIARCHC